jgi:hypothetical protein
VALQAKTLPDKLIEAKFIMLSLVKSSAGLGHIYSCLPQIQGTEHGN